MADTTSTFTWQFHRLGGLDQVSLRTSEELRHLSELNPKLWVALSCPATGLEFDQRTLSLIDTDNDQRIRHPEVLDAVSWLIERLDEPADMVDAEPVLPLAKINARTPQGANLLETAKSVLGDIGKADATVITYDDTVAALKNASKNLFNGDGIVVPREEFSEDARAFICDAISVIGGVPDASGEIGINKDIATAFADTMNAWKSWRESVDHTATPLGENTAEAWSLMQELAPKIEDFFLRTEMAAFAPKAFEETFAEETLPIPEQGLVATSALEGLPLARVEPERPLHLISGVNPAWRKRLARFGELVRPFLQTPEQITRKDWESLHPVFLAYEEAVKKKPSASAVSVTVASEGGPDTIGSERIQGYLSRNTVNTVLDLIAKDADAPAASTDIADLERMVLYHANLYRFLMNFVSFHDFYSTVRKASFQSGTLYLDGRSCRLCLPVTNDIAKHASLATLSQLFLVYCDCSRIPDTPGAERETMSIVAAVTAGSSDMLVEGRNGVYVDSSGNDWDATVVKVVSNPVSIRQAAWEPYKRLARTIGDQVAKFAASKQADIGKQLESAPPAAASGQAQNFDIGKSVGIFAAIGLALGALGTAAASIARALFALSWWQFPLVLLGAFLIVSGPSMILAWLKLRKRTLGPLLEASGWAVNSLVPINLALGKQLTGVAVLPENARRSFQDPFHKPKHWPAVLGIFLGIAVACAGYLYFFGSTLPWHLFSKP